MASTSPVEENFRQGFIVSVMVLPDASLSVMRRSYKLLVSEIEIALKSVS